MQLIIKYKAWLIGALLSLALLLAAMACPAQNENFEPMPTDSSKLKLKNIEVTFMTSYYQQDGNHSPVTGGIGTEKLDNIAPSIILKVPMDSVRELSINGGIDIYSSASSDNIDNPYLLQNHVSGASAVDERVYGTISYKKKNQQTGWTRGYSFGISSEYDVQSLNTGFSFAKISKDRNKELNGKVGYYFDDWKLIYPTELRNGDLQQIAGDKRHTITASLNGSFVINKRMNFSVNPEFIMQRGLLNTPFHRVFFAGEQWARVEKLPTQRLKFPVGIRFHYNASDYFMFRSWYRFYTDNWGMTGHTLRVEVPLKLSTSFRLYPFYRFHTQRGVDYFAPHLQHAGDALYYTADYDLSTLSSQKFGLGMSYSPLYGILRFKRLANRKSYGMWKSLDLRFGQYLRSDGLKAEVVTIGANFSLGRAGK